MANSATVGTLRILLTGDTAQFEKSLAGADASTKRLANTMKRDLEPSQARVNSLVRSFLGSKEIGMAENYARAVKEVGGAAKLTAADQTRVNRAVQEALNHYKALGQQAPQHLRDLANATKQVQAPVTGLATSLKALGGTFGLTLGAAAIGGFVTNIVKEGNRLQGVRAGFNSLTTNMKLDSEALLEAMQVGTRGLVSEVDLFQTANKALLLGLPVTVDSMGDMAQAATRLGKAMGLDAATSLDNLITALGRTSPLILDNLGLTVKVEEANEKYAKSLGKTADALTDAERKIAFYNEAMAKAKEKSEELGETAPTLSEQFDMAWIAIKDGAASTAAWLNATLGEGVQRIGDHIAFLYGRAHNLPIPSANEMQGMRDMARAKAGAPGIASPFAITVPVIGAADNALKAFNLTHGDAIREIEKHISAAERLEEAYRAFTRERLTGMTESQRQQQTFAARFLAERGLTSASAWAQSIVSKTSDWSHLLTGGGFSMPFAPLPSMSLPMPAKKAPLPLTVDDLLRSANIPSVRLGKLFGAGVGSFSSALPQTILNALTGGGNIAQSIGGLFGGEIGTSLMGTSTKGVFESGIGKMLQGSFLGKKIGGMVASFIPGVGALLGPALGKLFGAIGGISQNTSKGTREEFAKQIGFGSLDELTKKLQQMGAAGQALANTSLNVLGKKDAAGTQKWMKDVSALLDALPKKMDALTRSVQAFGGVAPKVMRPFIQDLLAAGNLPEDVRKQLEAIGGKPTWQVAAERAAALGVDPAMLGAGFNQSRIASTAFSLQHDIELFEEFNSNVMDFLPGLGDELSALAKEAIKTGAALPKTLEPYLRQLDAMGLLLDENGERIDMGALSFKDIEDESLKAIKDVLEDIRDLLAGKLPDAVRKFGAALGEIPRVDTGGFGMPRLIDDGSNAFAMSMPDMAAFNAQYAGAFSGAGQPPDWNELSSAGGGTAVIQIGERTFASVMVPAIPGATKRYQVGR